MSDKIKDWDIVEMASHASKFIETHFKTVLGLFIVGIVAGSVWTFMKSAQAQAEKEAFTELYKIIKIFEDKKQQFEEAKQNKTAKKDDQNKTTVELATGDLEKDFGSVVSQLENFIKTNADKNAAAEAALVLSEIYEDYNQPEKGGAALQTVLKSFDDKNVFYYVMHMRSGDLYASVNVCENAVPHWQKVANSQSFIKAQAQLKLGVCLQELGRIDEAISWFEQLKDSSPNTSESFNAKRYLRFLKFKKNNPDSMGTSKAQKKLNKPDKAS